MGLLLLEEVEDGFAHRAHRVTRVEDVDDNIGRVENLVELSPNTAGRSLVVDPLATKIAGIIRVGLFEELVRRWVDALGNVITNGDGSKLRERADIEGRSLALSLGSESVVEGLGLDDVGTLSVRRKTTVSPESARHVPLCTIHHKQS